MSLTVKVQCISEDLVNDLWEILKAKFEELPYKFLSY